jgi:hypothetical protein
MKLSVRHCSHCNNVTTCEVVYQTTTLKLWEDGTVWGKSGDDDWTRDWLTHFEPFRYCVVQCFTCEHLSLLGEFEVVVNNSDLHNLPQLYPIQLEFSENIPESIKNTYVEAATIRVRAPHAYAAQIRKGLEDICQNKGATGRTLFQQLQSLVEMGVLPSTLAEMTDLIRQIGNAGVHSDGSKISIIDTDLIDDFFRFVIEYVYVAPAKISELKRRIAHEKEPPQDEIPF